MQMRGSIEKYGNALHALQQAFENLSMAVGGKHIEKREVGDALVQHYSSEPVLFRTKRSRAKSTRWKSSSLPCAKKTSRSSVSLKSSRRRTWKTLPSRRA